MIIDVKVTYAIEDQRIKDLLVTAFEGGSNDWYRDLAPHYPEGQTKESLGLEFWHCDLPFVKGGYLTLEAPGADADDHKVWRIDRETLTAGMEVMAEKCPKHFAGFIQENDDAITADVFLQMVCFGRLVFG